jgi:hypothetical protein
MPKPVRSRRLKFAMAVVTLAVPSAVLASAAQPANSKDVAEPIVKKATKEKPPALLTPAELASGRERTAPEREAVLRWLFEEPPELQSKEASPHQPPGKPPGRPPSPPGHNDPPNPPGKPPDRPPDGGGNGNGNGGGSNH